MKNKEIERKFLVDIKDVPYDLSILPYGDITQGYITSIDKSFSFRIRQTLNMSADKMLIDKIHTQTIKSKDTKVRDEYEIDLNEKQFSTLWKLCMYNSIHKIRYKLPYNQYTIELDIYKNNLEGLYTVEVEFDNLKECDMFEPPEWFGEEVTELQEYKNVNIALNKGVNVWYGKHAHNTLALILKSDISKIENIINSALDKTQEKHNFIDTLTNLALNVLLNRLDEENAEENDYESKALKIRKICEKWLINEEKEKENEI